VQLWTAFVHTGWVGKAVLGILLLFSVLSWGTIFVVWRRFNRSEKASRRFVAIFRKAKRLADVQSASNALAHSALVGLFKAGYAEIEAQVAHDGAKVRSIDSVERSLIRTDSDEVTYNLHIMLRFDLELALLAELGFGLDLSHCAASGEESELVYVSPKSGRAVSSKAGEPWKERLLSLPAFLRGDDKRPSPGDIAAGFALTDVSGR